MPERLIRMQEVTARTGFKRSTIYLRMSQGRFPKPIPLGSTNAVAWLESEIDAWKTNYDSAPQERKRTPGAVKRPNTC